MTRKHYYLHPIHLFYLSLAHHLISLYSPNPSFLLPLPLSLLPAGSACLYLCPLHHCVPACLYVPVSFCMAWPSFSMCLPLPHCPARYLPHCLQPSYASHTFAFPTTCPGLLLSSPRAPMVCCATPTTTFGTFTFCLCARLPSWFTFTPPAHMLCLLALSLACTHTPWTAVWTCHCPGCVSCMCLLHCLPSATCLPLIAYTPPSCLCVSFICPHHAPCVPFPFLPALPTSCTKPPPTHLPGLCTSFLVPFLPACLPAFPPSCSSYHGLCMPLSFLCCLPAFAALLLLPAFLHRCLPCLLFLPATHLHTPFSCHAGQLVLPTSWDRRTILHATPVPLPAYTCATPFTTTSHTHTPSSYLPHLLFLPLLCVPYFTTLHLHSSLLLPYLSPPPALPCLHLPTTIPCRPPPLPAHGWT